LNFIPDNKAKEKDHGKRTKKRNRFMYPSILCWRCRQHPNWQSIRKQKWRPHKQKSEAGEINIFTGNQINQRPFRKEEKVSQ
tara:strand:- start:5212 stop:5457 length:246 start_codon:yes stop_codon:yes gene_type:complete